MEQNEETRKKLTAHFRKMMGMGRLIGNGLNYVDYKDLIDAVDAGADWGETCYKLGDRARKKAEEELEKGNKLTARTFFLNASAAYRVGQYTELYDSETKLTAYKNLMECFAEAAALFEPAYQKVEVPFEDYTMPGWLMLPPGADSDCPVVIVIGGADGWREEFHLYATRLLERGLAALIIDLPGQGETRLFRKIYQPVEIEKPGSAIIDWLYNDDRVGNNIGIAGHSFGGYLVPRIASGSDKLKACLAFGGAYDPTDILTRKSDFINVWSVIYNKSAEETREIIKDVNMKGLAEKITCPLMVVHGDKDPLFLLDDVKRLTEEASGPSELKVYPGDGHCCHNHDLEAILYQADWLANTLKKA